MQNYQGKLCIFHTGTICPFSFIKYFIELTSNIFYKMKIKNIFRENLKHKLT